MYWVCISPDDCCPSAPYLLQENENKRARFDAMLDGVREEGEREGVYGIDQVLSEMDEIIGGALG
ncbi:MAG: hypothetical protein HQL52_05205 [Magnetococcales bacterium]|nr:hypothetical protein [Magnetococcales bacterium]